MKLKKKVLRHAINECWKSIYHYLGKNENNPLDDDEFLYSHFSLFFDFNKVRRDIYYNNMGVRFRPSYKNILLDRIFSPKRLNSTLTKDDINESKERNSYLKEKITLTFIKDYVSDLKGSVETWFEIFNPKESNQSDIVIEYLDKIQRNRRWEGITSIILCFFRKYHDNKDRRIFLIELERAIFIDTYILRGISTIFKSNYFLELSKEIINDKISKENVILKITNETDKELKNEDKTWLLTFKDSNFYRWAGIQYFLYEYELHLLKKTTNFRMKLSAKDFFELDGFMDYKSVEHIYPQYARDKYWTEKFNSYNSHQRKKLRHVIGNLVPLSQKKNSQLSNKPFPEKKEFFAFGCYSENEIALLKDWGPDQIIERTIKMIGFLEDRWRIPVGKSRKSYLKFVGLDFYKKHKEE